MELRSSREKQKEDLLRILPSWSILLDNAEEVQGSWIIGTTREERKVEELIDEYCRSLPCDFVKRHSKKVWDSKDTPSRLLWETKDCPYSGVPFYVASHDVLLCTMNHNSKTGKKSAVSEGSKSSGRKKALAKNSSCEANIIVKRKKRYPTYAITTSATTLERLSALKTLKQDLEAGRAPAAEEVFWVRVPLASVHSHAFEGRARFTHPSIRNKILDLIHDGVEFSDGIMPLLRSHVEQRFQGSINPPALDDQAYYPSVERVKNLLYNYGSRKKRKVGEKSVFENVSPSLGTEEELSVSNCSLQTISDESNTILEQAVLETMQSNSTENTCQTPSVNVPSMESNVINTTSNVINTTSNVINCHTGIAEMYQERDAMNCTFGKNEPIYLENDGHFLEDPEVKEEDMKEVFVKEEILDYDLQPNCEDMELTNDLKEDLEEEDPMLGCDVKDESIKEDPLLGCDVKDECIKEDPLLGCDVKDESIKEDRHWTLKSEDEDSMQDVEQWDGIATDEIKSVAHFASYQHECYVQEPEETSNESANVNATKNEEPLCTVDKDRKFQCSLCDYKSNFEKNLKNHSLCHTDSRPFKCTQCSYKGKRKAELKNHLVTHTTAKPFKCPHCKYETNLKGTLKNHLVTHSEIKPFKCSYCDYEGKHRAHLSNHMLTHSEAKPHKCPYCNFETKNKWNLKIHMLTHSEQRDFKCNVINCNYETKRMANLKRHLLAHSGQKQHKCPHCSYEAHEKYNLKIHLMIHSDQPEKRFKCCQCDYRTNQNSNLKTHSLTHSDTKGTNINRRTHKPH